MKSLSVSAIGIFLLLAITIAGCKKETSSTLSGNIYGYVDLYDQYGSKILTSISRTTVTENGNTVTTDSTGKYTFTNLSAGQYSFSFSRTGFGSINSNALQFVGGGNLDHDVKLSAIPNFTDSILNITDTLGNVVLTGTLTGTDTRRRTVAVFVGSTVATSSNPANYLITYNSLTNNTVNTINSFSIKIPVADLTDAGFSSGSTVYFAVYGAAASFASTSTYEDLSNTGRSYFTALSPTAVTQSFVLP